MKQTGHHLSHHWMVQLKVFPNFVLVPRQSMKLQEKHIQDNFVSPGLRQLECILEIWHFSGLSSLTRQISLSPQTSKLSYRSEAKLINLLLYYKNGTDEKRSLIPSHNQIYWDTGLLSHFLLMVKQFPPFPLHVPNLQGYHFFYDSQTLMGKCHFLLFHSKIIQIATSMFRKLISHKPSRENQKLATTTFTSPIPCSLILTNFWELTIISTFCHHDESTCGRHFTAGLSSWKAESGKSTWWVWPVEDGRVMVCCIQAIELKVNVVSAFFSLELLTVFYVVRTLSPQKQPTQTGTEIFCQQPMNKTSYRQ